MTSLVHSIHRDCASPLGIPVDNLTMDEAVDAVLRMARQRDGRARLVSTLNVDFLVNSLGTWGSAPRHPELFDVLRNSDLVTADGFPILWLSRVIGRPLKQRVCGSDLVPALAGRAASEGLSLFLLGGGEGVAREAADTLQARYPGLRIAGTAAPFVHTEGPGLADCLDDDRELLARINDSGADVLLVGLGNPKQELWFNRNRDALSVPVSIGVGGTFEFMTGRVKRAPTYVQALNLEWLYRITQDPARLWRRYATGVAKLAALTVPLLWARGREKLAFALEQPAGAEAIHWRRVWSARRESLSVLRLPRYVSAAYMVQLARDLCEDPEQTGLQLLDFSRVRKIEMSGHQYLLTLAELQRDPASRFQLMAIPPALRRDLAATRMLDALSDVEGNTLNALGAGARAAGSRFHCSSYALDDCALIFLSGRVTRADLDAHGILECLEHSARGRDCILDLRNVTLLDSAAVAALAPFFSGRDRQQGRVVFSGLGGAPLRMIRIAGLGEPENSVNDRMLISVICDGGFGGGA